jgi:hypothetical protein
MALEVVSEGWTSIDVRAVNMPLPMEDVLEEVLAFVSTTPFESVNSNYMENGIKLFEMSRRASAERGSSSWAYITV